MKNGLPAVRRLDEVRQPVERGIGAEQIVEQRVDRLGSERSERDLAVVGLRHPRRLVLGAEVADREAARPLGGLDVIGEEDLGGGVEPVKVLEHRDAGLARAPCTDQALGHVEQPALVGLGIHARRRALGVGHSEEIEDQRQVLAEALVEQQQLAGDPLARRLIGVEVGDVEVGAHDLEHGQQRNPRRVRLAGGLVHGDPARTAAADEDVTEAALADAGLTDDADHLRPSRHSLLQRLIERLHLIVTADEPREAAGARDVEPPAGGADTCQLEHAQRLGWRP